MNVVTLPETNITPENVWLEYYFPFGMIYFQGRTVSFREGNDPYFLRELVQRLSGFPGPKGQEDYKTFHKKCPKKWKVQAISCVFWIDLTPENSFTTQGSLHRWWSFTFVCMSFQSSRLSDPFWSDPFWPSSNIFHNMKQPYTWTALPNPKRPLSDQM